MFKIQCPFYCLFGEKINCPYLDDHLNICYDVETAPGNEDAWCSEKIEKALDKSKESPHKRQNYSCNICGLKSFVMYNPKGDPFDIVIKIGKDHKEREPTCPCSLDDLNMIGEPTEI